MDKKGHPTGVLRERATDLITPFTEEKDQLVRRKYFEAGVAQCVAQGLTSLQSNDGGGAERGNRGGSWEHYVAMEQAGAETEASRLVVRSQHNRCRSCR